MFFGPVNWKSSCEDCIQNIKVGGIIQIYEEVPRITWKLGIINEVLPGKTDLYVQ